MNCRADGRCADAFKGLRHVYLSGSNQKGWGMGRELRAWRIYGAISALAFVVLAISAFSSSRDTATFGTITVHRINVIEPNGTLRMVISDKARFPGDILKNKQYPVYRHYAGMLFYNDEGTENGGLVFGGHTRRDGSVYSYGHLSFDRYDQDETFSLDDDQNGNGQSTRMAFIDRPSWPIVDQLRLPRSQWPHFLATHPNGVPRLVLARAANGAVSLAMKDRQGHTRILLKVEANGTPVIRVLDARGTVVGQLPRP